MPRRKNTLLEQAAQKQIAHRVMTARERLGLSITDLAYAFGVKRQTVQFWEKGESLPPADQIPKLCRLLGVDANELLGVELPPYDGEALRNEALRLAERGRLMDNREGPARKVPQKSARGGAAVTAPRTPSLQRK